MDQGKLATRRPRHATEEEVRYLLQIQGVLSNTTDENEKHILINNINEELRGSEVSLASNKKTSYVIQSILQNGNRDKLRLFLSYSKDFAVHMFTQTYASHCMQTALELANTFLSDRLDEPSSALAQRLDGEPLEPLLDLVNLFVENVLPRIVEVCCDVNGSHVLRSLLCVLLGCPNASAAVKKHIVKGALMKKSNAAMVEAFDEARSAVLFALAELGASEREWLMKNQHGCFIVQMLMNNLPAEQRTKLAHILLDVEDPDAAQKLVKELIVDVNGSRSLEGLVRSAADDVVNSFFISWE
ncbi:uncharacterized protein [Blastocystis hominis]|uniref:PUM-HD domain-containing protein n=1 Tax=Blastocystis hominis TaxID=12968 RepID=D8M0N6_BLAHO|nr:uncharacterized protein [Blastocystis hominis]CBK21625.2 unnamed protein product [Blastocystis hominis]|eukprot:XP_012895673.1 uncharacterized protein [Blastocystis hominis]